MKAKLLQLRRAFHSTLLETCLSVDKAGIPSIADKHQKTSVFIAKYLMERIGSSRSSDRLPGQSSGNSFEEACRSFIDESFGLFKNLRPGIWHVRKVAQRSRDHISIYEQYSHLNDLNSLSMSNPLLAASLGNDYSISPDLVVCRDPELDEVLDPDASRLTGNIAERAVLRKRYNTRSIIHASISCKWTLRSDRAQNARSEALHLLRNRKGRCPHIVVVTAEPTPSRLSSLALGTGDLDCVYHFALPELMEAVEASENDEALALLEIMVSGKRLKDIADLPLDLCV